MSTPLAIVVELYLNGAWVDVSADVYGRDDIDITRGGSDWSPDMQPGRCRLTLDNTNAKYSPFNPTGPYYGQLGRNIPMRVTVETKRRFLGEVSEWPLRADPDQHIQIEASGVSRRLAQCDTAAQSPMYRGLMRPVEPTRVPGAYWPCENISTGEKILPADSRRGAAMTVNLSATGLSTRSDWLGSEPLIVLNNTQMYADIPTYGSAGDETLAGALIRLPDAGLAADATPIMTFNTGGTAAYWRIRANINGSWSLQVADPFTDGGLGGVIATSGNTAWQWPAVPVYIGLLLTQSGSDINWTLYAWPEGQMGAFNMTGTVTGRTFVRATRVTIGSNFNTGETAIGHIAVWKSTTTANLVNYLAGPVNGWRGEAAADRVDRVAQEEAIVLSPIGDTADSVPMLQQGVKSGMDLLTEAVEADGGILYEPPDVPSRPIVDAESGTVSPYVGSGTTLAVSATQAHSGTSSIRVTYNASPWAANAVVDWNVVGNRYTYTAWVYVPTGSPAVRIQLGAIQSSPSTLTNTWQQLSVTYTATVYAHTLQVVPVTTPTVGQQMYFDDVVVYADRAGLNFKPLRTLYNQTPTLTLDYDAAEIALPFEPTDDDRWLVNEATVAGGGTDDPAQYSLATGRLSTQVPPNGAGRYAISVTRNVLTGDLASHWARWLVHVGTWYEPRFPQITANLNRKRALITSATLAEPGSVLAGTNPPAWLPPEDIKQVVLGLTETINVRTWKISYNCAPARPYDVVKFGDSTFRMAATDSSLVSTTTASATSFSVISTAESGRWTTTSARFPLNIRVGPRGLGGEEMTVTNITGTGLTQTFTVTRGVNGVTFAWPAGSAVVLSRRPTLAL